MAKVFSIHTIELRPGASASQIEQALSKATYSVPGQTVYLLKGNRGAREGQYLILAEFESVELRDRYFPSTDEASEEWQRLAAPFAAEFEQIGTLTTWPDLQFTDYTVVAQTK